MAYRFAVIGLGQFGTAIAKKLSERGAEVLAIDNNEMNIQNIKDEVAYAVTLDSTDKKALITQGIKDMDAVVVAIGENFEALLLTTVYLNELNVERIIARANGPQQRMILEKMGVDEILSPEDEVGTVVAERLINPNILSFLQLPDDYEVVEIKAPKGIIGKTLDEVGLRDKYKLTVVTIKRLFEEEKNGEKVMQEHVLGVPASNTSIQKSDTLMVFGRVRDIEKFIDIN
ncbi:TrkA family potassium uptake protein [Salibacter sp.]|jgi:trk system potassium uptake protein TrkA|uniref:potassium channel family protein n=1 Tax=Salibacter sp. TaxID=2010995 RepID=UPI00286FE5B6|nr:TrkA family potassium uptake protein [Salibacter sp.]MDR9397625.1 TrkA family potassium uptake protein [Salibacter sp.]MDR9486779.1 TrkA family potassium uptake protein [Salibacter sp.]